MRKVIGGVLGAAAGTFLVGAGGYLYGLLFLAWFGPVSCCGLEGLLPPIVGSVTGSLLGLTTGTLAGIVVTRGSPLSLLRLVLFLVIGVASAWLLSLFVGEWDIERLPGIITFLALTLYLPVIVWISAAWEKPDTSI